MLSPPPSSVGSSAVIAASALPHPRSQPLRPGGAKESALIRYLDSKLLHIQRRFAKRTTPTHATLSDEGRESADVWGDVQGYGSMADACKDISEFIGVVWTSGTPSLQVPYLISIALMMCSIVKGMPPTPKKMFRALEKLDHTFAGLLQGHDVESGEKLPGFERGRGISGTEKVRIRSLVERTRVSVTESMNRAEFVETDADQTEDEHVSGSDEGLDVCGDDLHDDRADAWDFLLARVYDRTLVELGDSLIKPDIGIITEGRG